MRDFQKHLTFDLSHRYTSGQGEFSKLHGVCCGEIKNLNPGGLSTYGFRSRDHDDSYAKKTSVRTARVPLETCCLEKLSHMSNLRKLELTLTPPRDLTLLNNISELDITLNCAIEGLHIPKQLKHLTLVVPMFPGHSFAVQCPPGLETFVLHCDNVRDLQIGLNDTLRRWELSSDTALSTTPRCSSLREFVLHNYSSVAMPDVLVWKSLECLTLTHINVAHLQVVAELSCLKLLEIELMTDFDVEVLHRFCALETLVFGLVGLSLKSRVQKVAAIATAVQSHATLKTVIVDNQVLLNK
jgi:hypothetical protein